MSVTAEDVRRAVHDVCSVLGRAADADWSVPAGDLAWDCRATAEHVADALLSYATQLVGEAADGWLPFTLVVEAGATPSESISVLRATGGLLAAAVATSPPGARGWHPYGTADREAFAAMAIVETYVHTDDIARGLHVTWSPSADLCEKALSRLFPDRPRGLPSWPCLLWCTGRADLPDLPRRGAWRWQNDGAGR